MKTKTKKKTAEPAPQRVVAASAEFAPLDLQQAMIALAPCVSKEETRYYLCGVKIEGEGGKYKFVATNGHMLGQFDIECFDTNRNEETGEIKKIHAGAKLDFILPAAFVNWVLGWKNVRYGLSKLVLSALPREHKSPIIKAELHGGNLPEFEPMETRIYEAIDGTFPDWRRVLPKAVNESAPAFNAGYVEQIAKAIKKARGGEMTPIIMKHAVEAPLTSPCTIETKIEGLSYVLMPMRV